MTSRLKGQTLRQLILNARDRLGKSTKLVYFKIPQLRSIEIILHFDKQNAKANQLIESPNSKIGKPYKDTLTKLIIQTGYKAVGIIGRRHNDPCSVHDQWKIMEIKDLQVEPCSKLLYNDNSLCLMLFFGDFKH